MTSSETEHRRVTYALFQPLSDSDVSSYRFRYQGVFILSDSNFSIGASFSHGFRYSMGKDVHSALTVRTLRSTCVKSRHFSSGPVVSALHINSQCLPVREPLMISTLATAKLGADSEHVDTLRASHAAA